MIIILRCNQLCYQLKRLVYSVYQNQSKMLGSLLKDKENQKNIYKQFLKYAAHKDQQSNIQKRPLTPKFVFTNENITHLLSKMTTQNIQTPEACLKLVSFCYMIIQQIKDISEVIIQLKQTLLLLFSFSENLSFDNHVNCNKSKYWFCKIFLKTNDKGRQNDDEIKFTLLCQTLTPPLINYIFYAVSHFELYKKVIDQSEYINEGELVVCFNLLNSSYEIFKHFKSLGRYYPEDYQKYIVMLTELIGFDAQSIYNKIKYYILNITQILRKETAKSSLYKQNSSNDNQIQTLVKILQNVQDINGKLSELYLCKYFHQKIRHVPKPKWIKPELQQFAFLFEANSKKSVSKTKTTKTWFKKIPLTQTEDNFSTEPQNYQQKDYYNDFQNGYS